MAIAKDHVQVFTGVGSGVAQTVTSSTGNLSVVVWNGGSGQVLTGVVDSKGNAYVAAGDQAGSQTLTVWYAKNAATGITTVTATWTGAGNAEMAVYDCSGADATNPLAAYSSMPEQGNATTNPTGPTVNVPTGGGIVVTSVNAVATAMQNSFTLDSGAGVLGFGSLLNGASGAFTPSWTTGSVASVGVTAAFKSTAGVPLLVVHTVGGSGSNPTTIVSTTAHNLLVVGILGTDQTAVISGVTDNAPGGTNVYVSCANSLSLSAGVPTMGQFWYAKDIKAGTTSVTVAFSSGSFVAISVWEVSGADLTSPFDVANHADTQTGGSSGPPFAMSNPSLTTNFAQEFIAGFFANADSVAIPYVNDPFILVAKFMSGHQIVIATGTYNAVWDSNTTSDPYHASLAGFRVASAGGDIITIGNQFQVVVQ